MPQHSIHLSKKEAILRLCNFVCDRVDVTDFTQLCDGAILLKTIEDNFQSFLNDSKYVVEDVLDATESKEKVENEENTDDPATNINFNFNRIQKFIDDRYGIKSCEIISYADCFKKDEFEISKVAIFVLSEIVKLLLDKDPGRLATLYHIDPKYQVELQDFFKLFISERGKISKDLVEKLLLKSSVKFSPFLTPIRHSPRHKETKSISPSTPTEDIFSNSPLKGYFESPIFKKEDISMKERIIENLKIKIEQADEEITEHQCKISGFEKELKKKDQQIQKLQKIISEMKDEMQVLQNSCQSESCKADKEALIKRCKDAEQKFSSQEERLYMRSEIILNLEQEKSKLEKQLDEERAKSIHTGIGASSTSPTQYERLQEKYKYLELKVFALKKQLSEKIITDLKAKEFSENSSKLNKTYEELWAMYGIQRKEHEENLAFLIQEDNRQLIEEKRELQKKIGKLQKKDEESQKKIEELQRKDEESQKKIEELQKKNEELLKKIEIFEKNASSQAFTSIATDTDLLIPTEKLRKSISYNDIEDVLSNETLSNFNNSDNSIQSEEQQPAVLLKSGIGSESPKPMPDEGHSESPKAVLWTVYDKEPETEISDDFHFSHGNAHSNATSSLEIENVEMENTEACVSPCQDKKYMFGNLNFDAFLNELKKLTKNGSFQKVLQALDKINNKIDAKVSKSLDIQELLKIITQCICIVVNLNSKSIPELKDKSVGTEESEFHNHNIEIYEGECEDCIKYENELVQVERKLEELTKERDTLKSEFQGCKDKAFLNERKLEKVIKNYEGDRLYFEKMKNKYQELKDGHSELMVKNKKLHLNYENCRVNYNSLYKRNEYTEKLKEGLRKKVDKLKLDLQKSKELNKKLQEEKELLILGTDTTNLETKEAFVEEPSSVNATEFYSNVSQDTANESAMSAAFHKNHYISENEEDFVYYNSLSDTMKRSMHVQERVQELKRRNSVLPVHLQSAYPIEADLSTNYDSMYIKDDEKFKEERCSKKRKLEEKISEEPSTSFQSSWNHRISQKFKSSTPKRLSNIMKKVYNKHNTFSMKPKK